jgi:hypothetical protein
LASDPLNQVRRYYQIGGLTLQVESDIPFSPGTFVPQIEQFHTNITSDETIILRHHFFLPQVVRRNLGREIFNDPPWAIFQSQDSWVYLGIPPDPEDNSWHKVAFFNPNHTEGSIYSPDETVLEKGNLYSLTTFPTDQILLARILADRQGCYLHAAGLIIDGKGLAFVGHSEAGKTTITRLLMPPGEILCDDRVILRRWPNGIKIYGTWSHGDIPIVSPASAPLRALFILDQASENSLYPLTRQEVIRTLPQFIIRPLITKDWWEKTLDLVGHISREVPVFRLRFDKSGKVIDVLRPLL